MKKVILISAHPDDETLGCGGTLLKHLFNNDEVYWLNVTDVFENEGFSKERVDSRAHEIERVFNSYGFKEVIKFDYPTMSLESASIKTMIPKISEVFMRIKPEIIYVVNRSDAHSDHRITFDAVMACTKSFRYPFIKQVMMYECISETEFAPALPEKSFIPNHFVDISDFMDKKVEIMNVYESELDVHPFPRSIRNIKALSTFRGAMIGEEYAEAFQLLLSIDK
jgi:LmbE family N-acetylglucosaminyl deacetylase